MKLDRHRRSSSGSGVNGSHIHTVLTKYMLGLAGFLAGQRMLEFSAGQSVAGQCHADLSKCPAEIIQLPCRERYEFVKTFEPSTEHLQCVYSMRSDNKSNKRTFLSRIKEQFPFEIASPLIVLVRLSFSAEITMFSIEHFQCERRYYKYLKCFHLCARCIYRPMSPKFVSHRDRASIIYLSLLIDRSKH